MNEEECFLDLAERAGIELEPIEDPWAPLDDVRVSVEQVYADQTEDMRAERATNDAQLQEAMQKVGVDLQDPVALRNVMLGAAVLWQLQAILAGKCSDAEHVLSHVNQGGETLFMSFNDACAVAGIRDGIAEEPPLVSVD